jgi:hypothetical protein
MEKIQKKIKNYNILKHKLGEGSYGEVYVG